MPDYSVRLVIRLSAESPEQAAPTFITHLVENGMTDWVYQVCEPEGDMKVLGYFDGYGLAVDVEAESERVATVAAEQTGVQTDNSNNDDDSDGALLNLAQELNEQDQPTDETTPPPPPQE